MEALKWSLVFIWLCCKGVSPWTAQIPSSVKGLIGSCLVIPCTFNYPDPARKVTEFTGIWADDTGHLVYHPTHSKIQQQYRDRTGLVGDVRHKNCSLMIDPLRQSDHGPFHFRIEIADFNSFSYKDNKVSLLLNTVPNAINLSVEEEAIQGQAVSASCSVSHSCPNVPPVFNWSRSGETRYRSQQLDDGQWEAKSILTFHPTRFDHRKSLQCSVKFKGGQHREASKTLKVKYSPVNVNIEYKAEVKEGETVHLSCTADAHPPVSSYEWHNGTGTLLHKGKIYMLPNVSRHTGVALYCLGINAIGRAKSSSVQLNVLYAPEIKTASSCSLEGNGVKCVCIVESKPPSTVHFVLADRVLQGFKVEKHGSLTLWTLQTDFGSSDSVRCIANNTQGHTDFTLSLPVNSKMQNILIASGAVLIFFIISSVAVGIFMKSRGTPRDTSDLSIMPDKAVDLPQYTTTKRKETFDDIGGSEMYANDHIYGNLDDDGSDAIYANV